MGHSEFRHDEESGQNIVPTVAPYQRKGRAKRIAINDIQIGDTPRRLGSDLSSIDDLADSIRDIGLLQPIVVRESNHLGDKKVTYELISGHRRFQAVQQLGHTEINAVIVSDFTDADMAIASIRENLDRKNYEDYETFLRLQAIDAQFPKRAKIAEDLGLCRSIRYRILSFSKLPAFVREDLHHDPKLLSGKSSEAVCKVLNLYGEEGLVALRVLWKRVVEGELRQGRLADALEDLCQKKAPPEHDSNVRPLLVGDQKAGTSKISKSSLLIKIDRRFLPDDQAEVLLNKISKHLELSVPNSNRHGPLQDPVSALSPTLNPGSDNTASADYSLSPDDLPIPLSESVSASDHETGEASKQPELIILTGIAASGKSTYCKQNLHSHHVVSLDAIPSNSRKKEEMLFKQLISDRKSIVVDNTNLTRKDRARYIEPAISAGYRIVGIELKTQLSEALRRNKSRPNRVPEAAIKRQSKQVEPLDRAEGFHQIRLEPAH